MNRKRGKKEVLKGTLAIGLLINQFSSFGAIVNATVYESEVENNSDIVQESIDSSQDDLPDLDGNLSNESTENEEIQNPGDGLPEEIPNDEEFGETEDVELEIPKVEEDLDSADGSEESKSPEEQIEEELLEETASINLEDDGLFSIESRSSGSGLVQLWQVVPDGQQSKEGKTTSEIMKAVQCKPNHNLYPSGGQSEHNTYVNSCYVDDALYLGEDTNYYYIYLSGYEGKVPKSESHWFELDLNNDGTKVKYEIQTVAYYIPGGTTMYSLQEKTEPLDVPELNYYDQYLDKYNDINERGITTFSTSTVQSPSYYANENGTLVHYLTSNVTKANSYSKVIVGKAPSWMSSNVKYYSYDGIYFYTNWRNIKVNGQGAVNQSNPFYNYYQYLPVRSKSNYSANIFDNYTNSNGGAGGKLVNTGQYFYAVQDKYGINGALQYAMGIHESGWGKSSLSLNKNNLFGMNATDNNPYGNGTSFPSVEAGINYHADRYLSWGYTDPVDDWRYMGSHVGNKGSGMNVRYASDPFWGEKIAGWYYRFDSASGLKDYDYYTIGIKQSNAVVDVKSQANSSSSTLYQTKNKKSNIKIYNYPFLITGEQNGYYCVKTDTPIVNGKPVFNGTYSWGLTNGYILKSEINILNHSLYRNPVDSRSNVISAIGNIIIEPGRINIDGWAFIEGLSINNVDDISTTLLLKDLRGDIIKSYPTTVVFRPDVTMVYGEGKYNYSFSGFQVSIPEKDLVDLSSGNYSLELQMNPKYFNEKVITLSAGDLVSTGQYQHKKVQLKDVENKLILNLTHEEISGVNNIIVNQSNVLFNGFSFIKGLNISTTSDSQKKVVINNKTTGQQVYSGPVDNIKREDVTQAYGNGKYNYDYAGFLVDLPMSVLDTLMIGEYEIVMNVTQGKVTETISLIGPEKQASYIGPNGKVTLSVNGKQMSIKVEPVTYEKVSGVNNIIVNQSNVLFNGFSFIKELNISTTSDSQKKVVINNKTTGQQVYSGPVDNIKREDVTQAYGNGKYNYDYAGFLVDLPMSVLDTLMIGEYEIVMNVTQGKVTETISLIGPEKQASYIGPNGKVTLSVNGKQMSIKVEPVTYEKVSGVNNIIVNQSNALFNGFSFIKELNISTTSDSQKKVVINNKMTGQQVYSGPVDNIKREDVTQAYGNGKYNYDYAGFLVDLPMSVLDTLMIGEYEIVMNVTQGKVTETISLIGPEKQASYIGPNGKVTLSVNGKQMSIKVEPVTYEKVSGVNNIIVNQSNVLFNGFSFIKELNISTTSDSQKKVVINNKMTGQQVYSGPVDNIKREDVTQAYGNGKYNYDYAGFLVDLPMSVLDTLMIGEYEIVMNVTQGKVTETISLIGPEKQASYIGPNGKVTLSVNGKQMSIKVEPVTYEKVSGVNNIIVNQSNVLFNGFSFIKGLNISTTSDSQKKVVINNKTTGQQVYSGPVDNIKREDVTQAYGNGKYNYDYAGFLVDLPMSVLDTLMIGEYEIVMNVTQGKVTETISLIGPEKQASYIGPNGKVTLSVNGKQMSIKVEANY